MSKKTEHLLIIQDVINRLANNSFKLKGWAATIVSALVALSTATSHKVQILIIVFAPLLVFWILDGYFLWQERLFRSIYNSVRKKSEADIDFDMNPQKFIGGRNSWFSSIMSITLILFYGILLLSLFSVIYFL